MGSVVPPQSARDTASALIANSPVPTGGPASTSLHREPEENQQPPPSRELRFLTNIVTQMQDRGAADAEIYNYLVHYQRIRPAMLKVLNAPPDPDATSQAPGVVRGVALSAMQGLTFGFGDEAIGGTLGLLTGRGWQNGVDNYRQELDAFRQEHGKTALAGEIGGALMGGVGGVRLLAKMARGSGAAARGAAALQQTIGPGASALAKPTTVAATGALAGGLQAAGDTEGGVGERLRAAPVGAVFGGVAGVTLVGGARLVGNLARPAVRQATLGARAFQRALPGIGTPEMQARELVLRALDADGLTKAELRRRAAQRAAQGLPTTIADIAGDNTRELIQSAVRLRSPAKQQVIDLLQSRQVEQGDRILGDLMTSVFRNNTPGLRLSYHAGEQIRKSTQRTAAPHYFNAYEQTVPITPTMRALLKRPHFRRAYNAGLELARDEDLAGTSHGLPVPKLRLSKPRQPAGFGRIVDPVEGLLTFEDAALDAQHQLSTRVPVRALDLMKRGLDDIIQLDRQAAKPTITRQRAKAWRKELGQMLENDVDPLVPDYATARSISQHGFEVDDAINLGRDWAKTHPEEIQKIMRELPTEGARQGYRIGAMQDLAERIGEHGGKNIDFSGRFFGANLSAAENNMTRRIRALFPDPAQADEFIERLHHEARMSQTFAEVGHRSAAQPLDNMLEDIAGSSQLPIRGGIGATIRGGGVSFFGRAVARQRTGWTQEVSDAVSDLFLRGLRDPGDLDAMLASLTSRTLQTATTARLAAPVAIGQQAGQIGAR